MKQTLTGVPQAAELAELHREHLWLHLTNHRLYETQEPPIMAEGKGYMLKDIQGREFVDGLSGGVWVVNVGHGRESIADAVSRQLKTLPYYAGSMATPPYIMLAAKLASLLPSLPKVYLSNSGSEANEKAFKMVRQYFAVKSPGKKKYKIIYRNRDYHGTTLAALASSGQQERKADFGPLPEGFAEIPHALCYRCPFGKSYPGCNIDCARALEQVIQQEGEDSVAAVILEPVTAGGGIIPPVPEYYPVLQEICRRYGVLLILDEVVTGFGRTGALFGHQHYDVEPDIITLAKGLASGYMPISATLARKEIFSQFLAGPEEPDGFFRDISTFGGCAGSSVAALENIRIIEEERLAENSAVMGAYLLECLRELEVLPIVGNIRGQGLLAGVELVEDKRSKVPLPENRLAQVVAAAREEGVIIGRMTRSVPGYNNVLYMAPPLIIDKYGIDRITGALGKALRRQL
ncbi:aminotransferase class III-fold pyridoxal phosphate-dependent enzyme [Paenibacillus sp. MMS20-IR301]|uniref:aminotransferase family protein n=1 Tax=Paenibacillus sp. MMS20-IR301 TaxID=2895946 RepID=UPI0028EB0608|nr:aminotransferase class III-fold pyridoxal phosphate-dependent enzyme [Paenibacillus sp. MMS20-IR301]WNS43962.1 aminotransferase class III-fold pyridoxal phosphate-dependent enzyme [Paenibacillus sp. MMS20-IR301]